MKGEREREGMLVECRVVLPMSYNSPFLVASSCWQATKYCWVYIRFYSIYLHRILGNYNNVDFTHQLLIKKLSIYISIAIIWINTDK